MIITRGHIATHTISPMYWFGNYSVYPNAGGLILARISDGHSTYFQPGDDANSFEDEADKLMKSVGDDDEDKWNVFCSAYDELMVAPEDAGGTPSSDGGFWAFI